MAIKVEGQLVDLHHRRIYPAELTIQNGLISHIREKEHAPDRFLMPGFVDAHIHIESSMLVPYEFARIALRHGTIATVSDPHEIANVLGLPGVEYMLENGKECGLKFHFGAPSCVPATSFETSGATLDADAVGSMLNRPDIIYLSEMMNYPGVLNDDPEVMFKINKAKALNKRIDGHAPGLRGMDAKKYIDAGISTDHECFTLDEALDKLKFGMKIIIREGSAARNFETLHSLISTHTDQVMLCSDDKHPDDLLRGHINELVKRALDKEHDFFDVMQVACLNPVFHYDLSVGLLRKGDPADFIVVDNLTDFNVLQTWCDGQLLFEEGKTKLEQKEHDIINQFVVSQKTSVDFQYDGPVAEVPVIGAIDGEIITRRLKCSILSVPSEPDKMIKFDTEDVLPIAVVNRYGNTPVALGFIHGTGLKQGAMASTVAHDSHNIIAVGCTAEDLSQVVNMLMDCKGGLAAVNKNEVALLPLPIGGLMSPDPCEQVGRVYEEIDQFVKRLGSTLSAPFMTLSFMALLVIPEIKISDKGMFDAVNFKFC